MDPCACLASRPVSSVRARPPTMTDSRTNMDDFRSGIAACDRNAERQAALLPRFLGTNRGGFVPTKRRRRRVAALGRVGVTPDLHRYYRGLCRAFGAGTLEDCAASKGRGALL